MGVEWETHRGVQSGCWGMHSAMGDTQRGAECMLEDAGGHRRVQRVLGDAAQCMEGHRGVQGGGRGPGGASSRGVWGEMRGPVSAEEKEGTAGIWGCRRDAGRLWGAGEIQAG